MRYLMTQMVELNSQTIRRVTGGSYLTFIRTVFLISSSYFLYGSLCFSWLSTIFPLAGHQFLPSTWQETSLHHPTVRGTKLSTYIPENFGCLVGLGLVPTHRVRGSVRPPCSILYPQDHNMCSCTWTKGEEVRSHSFSQETYYHRMISWH